MNAQDQANFPSLAELERGARMLMDALHEAATEAAAFFKALARIESERQSLMKLRRQAIAKARGRNWRTA